MKKRIEKKKLSLNKETLRQLSEPDIRLVLGGLTQGLCDSNSCVTVDNCTGSCNSFRC